MKKLIVIGGGASAYFLAANLGWNRPEDCLMLEKAPSPLQKVRISGGGRCNVTHACFDPMELVENYPRGGKELISLFNKFQPGDTMQWFEDRGVPLKIEQDNRVFPQSDSSQSIVDCLIKNAENQIKQHFSEGVTGISHHQGIFEVKTTKAIYHTESLVVATGSSKGVWNMMKELGHTIVPPVASLFTFNINDRALHELSGISFPEADLEFPELGLADSGPLLITHWGLSGPAVLRLSATGARILSKVDYKTRLVVNFVGMDLDSTFDELVAWKNNHHSKSVKQMRPFPLPKRFWEYILNQQGLDGKKWQEISNKHLRQMCADLCQKEYPVNGKSTFKEEFVTAGGVDLKEIDFRNMQSKIIPNLFIVGECLNIDAVTGGFNFQACWSEAWVLSEYLNALD